MRTGRASLLASRRKRYSLEPSYAEAATYVFGNQSEARSSVTAVVSGPNSPAILDDDHRDKLPEQIKSRFSSSKVRKDNCKENSEYGIRGPDGLWLVHRSPEPLINLIFVHGLRGGSIKTWRKGNDPRCFWPRFWLPMEPGFGNVNIYTFGYNSDWASLRPGILDISDIGRALLEDMRNVPYLKYHPEV